MHPPFLAAAAAALTTTVQIAFAQLHFPPKSVFQKDTLQTLLYVQISDITHSYLEKVRWK